MLAVMKKISALNMEERRAHQEGEFRIKLGSAKYRCQLVSQGTKTGERTILELHSREDALQDSRRSRHAGEDAR